MALHTRLRPAEITGLRWEHLHQTGDAGGLVMLAPSGSHPVGDRLERALRDQRLGGGWVFVHQDAHISRQRLWRHLHQVAAHASLTWVSFETVRVATPGNVNPDLIGLEQQTSAARLVYRSPTSSEITLEDLMATGLAKYTARPYRRVLARVAELLAERRTDLDTCTGPDLAAVADCFPDSHSTKAQLRGAIRHAWYAIGREHPPSMLP